MIRSPDTNAIKEAAQLIRAGELVAFPTETVYGLGASAFDDSAVQKIFAAKGRPSNNPLIVHIASLADIEQVASIAKGSLVEKRLGLLQHLWPGPLSVILPKGARVAPTVCANLPSVAVRIPKHPVALSLISAAGVPIAAPSANLSSYVSPTTAQHVQDEFADKLRIILDGGSCEVGLESTIIDICSSPPKLLRPGGISFETLRALLPDLELNRPSQDTPILSPGLLKEHYSPRTKTILRGSMPPQDYPAHVALISFTDQVPPEAAYCQVCVLSRTGKLEEIAARLFSTLRELDKARLDLIVVDSCDEVGLGRAIMDRLMRATARYSSR